MLDLLSLGGVIKTKLGADILAKTVWKKKKKKSKKENNKFIM